MVTAWESLGGLVVDGLIGDPDGWLHPVRLMGTVISWYSRQFNRRKWSKQQQRLLGVALALGLPSLSWALTTAIVGLGFRIASPLGWLCAIGAVWASVAWRGLLRAGQDVSQALERGLLDGRRAVSQYVGRDTDHLTETEVVRATVETLAENLVDAVIAPLFYAVIGGPGLTMAYRAVNTLDAMVGYREDPFRDFGWASARLDDIMNFVPARLASLVMWMALTVAGFSSRHGWEVMRRDAAKHPSPNAGIPESMMAGGLGVQLGGLNYYHGIPSFRATLGDSTRPLSARDIQRAGRVVWWVGILSGLTLAVLGVWRW